MGAGKTERPTAQDSLFTKGRRVNKTNDNVLRGLRVKGGRLRKVRDKWTIEVPKSSGGGGGGGGDLEDEFRNFEGVIDLKVEYESCPDSDSQVAVLYARRGRIRVNDGFAEGKDPALNPNNWEEILRAIDCVDEEETDLDDFEEVEDAIIKVDVETTTASDGEGVKKTVKASKGTILAKDVGEMSTILEFEIPKKGDLEGYVEYKDAIVNLEVESEGEDPGSSGGESNPCTTKTIKATRANILIEKDSLSEPEDLIEIKDCKQWDDLMIEERGTGSNKRFFLVPARKEGFTLTPNSEATGVRCVRLAINEA